MLIVYFTSIFFFYDKVSNDEQDVWHDPVDKKMCIFMTMGVLLLPSRVDGIYDTNIAWLLFGDFRRGGWMILAHVRFLTRSSLFLEAPASLSEFHML